MFKAVWFMIFPIVDFTRGPILSEDKFCQISGFFLTVGIEASDIAVLLMAVHTALYIFQPRGSRGEYGLYPYRHAAYAFFFLVPLLLASLAFLNGSPAFENSGEFCYLAARPSWSQMALSWTPRYIIFLLILGTYACIYFYVRYLIRRFGRSSPRVGPPASTLASSLAIPQTASGDTSVPSAPPTIYHGLTPSTFHLSIDGGRQDSVSTTGSLNLKLENSGRDWAKQPTIAFGGVEAALPEEAGIKWNWTGFGGLDALTTRQEDGTHSPTAATSRRASVQEPLPLLARENTVIEEPDSVAPDALPVRTPWYRIDRKLPERSRSRPPQARPRTGSVASILSSIRNIPAHRRARGSYSSTTSSTLVPTRHGSTFDGSMSTVNKTREKIRRQLRLLFIYPLVYVLVWLVPFISHAANWDDPAVKGPFPVLVVSLASICAQGAINSLVFSTREKPWRHVKGSWTWGWSGGLSQAAIGRTREEMILDGQTARRRRDAEIEERRIRTQADGRRPSRQWWDAMEVEEEANSSDEELLL